MNKISIVGDIDSDAVKKLIEDLSNCNSRSLTIDISSGGGYSEEGLAMYSLLSTCGSAVKVIGRAQVSSAAIAPFLAGKDRWCTKECQFLIHNDRVDTEGDYRDLRKQADQMEDRENTWAVLLESITGTPKHIWRELSDDERTLTAEEALAVGLVTKII